MTNSPALLKNFSSLVGFKQPDDPNYNRLPAYLTESASGRYVQSTHPLCTIENLYNSAPEFDKYISDYPAWAAGDYIPGAVVVVSGKLFQAMDEVDETVGTPVVGSTADDFGQDTGKPWRRFDGFVDWLDHQKGSAILEFFSDFIKFRKLENADRSLLESQALYDGLGASADRIIKEGRFVGFELTLSNQQGITAIINRIGLQLDGAKDVPIYLYHSTAAEPIAVLPLSIIRPLTFSWNNVAGGIMAHYSDLHGTGGRFYLGYYELDLGTTQAIRRQYDFAKGDCYTCNQPNWQAFQNWSKYVTVRPFSVPATAINEDRTLWDADAVTYDSTNNWGVNMALTVACDLTETFSTNKLLFADALAKKICLKLLAVIAYSTRINAVKDNIKALAMADLLPNEKSNFQAEYRQEIEALQVDFSGMNSACMPCMGNRRKITLGAV